MVYLNVTIFIKDNGRGTPQGDISRIFERFYRVEKSRSREKGGTGLGLAIVERIVSDHDGSVRFEANEPTGSRFVVEIPNRA